MYRLILSIVVSFCLINTVKSQQLTYNYIDSLSYQQYIHEQWDSLLQTSNMAKKANIAFPLLNMRVGYAALMKNNHSLSLQQYNKALAWNSYNQDALYFVALNNSLLSRNEAASFMSKNLNVEAKKQLGMIDKKAVQNLDFESSFKSNSTEDRRLGQYYRIGIGSKINYRWKLYQSIAIYRQNLLLATNNLRPPPRNSGTPDAPMMRNFLVADFQYYVKSEIFINSKLSFINAFHFINTNFDNSHYATAIFNCGLKITQPFADFKIEFNAGTMIDSLIAQAAFSGTYFPFGNTSFYGNSRFSFQKRTNLSQFNYSQMFGFKLNRKIWLETHATLGEIKNLIDNESFYIYDALDPGKFRIGSSIILPLTPMFKLSANYYYEQKKLYLQNSSGGYRNYNLNSFSIGLSWKL